MGLKRILLMGNPNVGKSVFFSRITGVKVIASNYPGTTVGFTKGSMKLGEEEVEVIDVPGTYTLEATSKAEEVASQMLQDGDLVINVADATNLERNLYLTQELLERQIPVIVALNIWDDTKHKGISIDVAKLEERLGVPVLPTVAVTGQGIKELVDRIPEAISPALPQRTRDERWAAVGDIIEHVQTITHHHHTWLERLQDASIKPLTGLPIAAVVLAASFLVIRFIGEGLIGYVLEPLFENLWAPLMMKLSVALGSSGFWHDMLIGNLFDGEIDFFQSMGVLTTGLFIPLGAVLPYILAFYLILGLLEDVGYLPRLAVLLDNLMHRMGLHGYAIIPTMLGLGCCVPAIMATRILESKRERFIAATLISIAIPCAASQAMIIGLVGAEGGQYVAMVYGTLFVVWLTLGLILNRAVRGFSPELLIEIPPYRRPSWRGVLTKLWMRTYGFLREALPIILLAIFAIGILYHLGVFDAIANFTAPVVSGLFGLPEEGVVAIVVGFLRKDVAIGLLAPLSLSAAQLVVGSVVLTMFLPCIAAFVVLARELGIKGLLMAIGIMLAATVVVGGLLNLVL
ncbi:MAG: iron transporter FeoB [Dehalococcoidia bacterium DG_18]|nr:MAG: iron transporter FeoB [Dehalococcoidia bacterium DG_18]